MRPRRIVRLVKFIDIKYVCLFLTNKIEPKCEKQKRKYNRNKTKQNKTKQNKTRN